MNIVEPIGRHWQSELIYLPVPGMGGPASASAAVQVIDARSGQVLPAQACVDPEDPFATQPWACARIDLAPGQERELQCRAVAASAARGSAAENPFSVVLDGEVWQIANGPIAVRVPASQVVAGDGAVPGPVLALRGPGQSAWTGKGSWGPPPAFMVRIETIVLERGPLVARWVTRYLVGGVEWDRYDIRLIAGEDFLDVRQQSREETGAAFRLALVDEDGPRFWCSYGGGEAVDTLSKPLHERPPAFGCRREKHLLHIDFHSGHAQMSLTWAGFFREGGPVIGVCQLGTAAWEIPGKNRIFALEEQGGMVWEFPARGGRRRFALVAGAAADYAPAKGMSRFCSLRRKYSDIPLQKVGQWVTRFPLRRYERAVLYPAGSAEHYRQKLAAWPQLQDAYRRLADSAAVGGKLSPAAKLPTFLATGHPAARAQLFEYVESALEMAVRCVVDNGYIRLIIFHGRDLKVVLEAIDMLRAMGELDEATFDRWALKSAFLAHCFADDDFWPYDSFFRASLDARGMGPEMWDEIGDIICPPNFTTEYFTSFALAGLCFPEHPQARQWIARGVELFERNLETQFFESGAYSESLNYHDHELQMLLQTAIALEAAGVRDFFAHPRFRRTFGFFLESLTPPIAPTPATLELLDKGMMLRRPGPGDKVVMVSNWGNSGWDCSGHPLPQPVAVAAGIYAARDRAYAARLMSAWRQSTQCFATNYAGLSLLALGDPTLPDVPLHLASTLIEGLGAAMRAGQGTPGEILAWVKSGVATHHNCRDDGGLILYAHGAPLIGDLGYFATHQGVRSGAFETWKHCCVTFGGQTTSMFRHVEHADPPTWWHSDETLDLLIVDRAVDRILATGGDFLHPQPCPRIDHRRCILFAKPHFLVIYDHIAGATLPSTCWLHALADAVEIRPQHALFRGRYGVDLDVQVLLPVAAQISAGEFSVQRHIRIEHPRVGNSGSPPGAAALPVEEYLTVLTPLAKGAQAPSAAYQAEHRRLEVRGAWGVRQIVLPAPAAGHGLATSRPKTADR